jgi:diacylglycerol kinase family enzyme
VAAAWYGVLHTGFVRTAALLAGALLLAGGIVLVAVESRVAESALILGGLVLAAAAARIAFAVHVPLSLVPRPEHPVLFMNPRSGGGKAEKLHLADEARTRGIEPVELGPGDDLRVLVRHALDNGADALAMAGGDGSQAIVAAIAAERGLPYACIPAGTRNHFALDLGVDRDDVVGALDAFVNGGERRVDLAEVNGRTFVNNVSLGLYAEAVQRAGYRDAKMRTILDTVPEVMGHDGGSLDLHFLGPDGRKHASGPAILVSNNRYRLGRAIGSGTRPRIDEGELGIAVVQEHSVEQWTAPSLTVESGQPVMAGIDGEAAKLEAPVTFRIRPGALRVRIASEHPGASPSAVEPDGAWDTVRALARIAAGHGTEGGPV